MKLKAGDKVYYHSWIGGPIASGPHEILNIIDIFGCSVAELSNFKYGQADIEALSLCTSEEAQ